MKRYILRIFILTMVVLMLACSLISCNKLSGTYASVDSEIYTTYKFNFFGNKLVASYLSIPIEGEYEIDGDKIYITIANDRQEHSYSKDGKTIYIDGVAYKKQ